MAHTRRARGRACARPQSARMRRLPLERKPLRLMQIGRLGRWSKRWPGLASRAELRPSTPDVALAPGADENGLAIMLGDLVRQNLEAKPKKMADFDALEG